MEKFTKSLFFVATLATTITAFAGHGWKRVNYTNSSIFTAVVSVNGQPANEGDEVGIFVNGECRMLSKVFVRNDTAFVSAVIHCEKTDTATIKFWSSTDEKEYDVDTTVISKPAGEIDRFPIKVKTAKEIEIVADEPLMTNLEIVVSPSHAKNDITIMNARNITSVVIYNNIGNVVIKQQGKSKKVDVSSLPSGIFFVEIKTQDQGTVTRKFMKNE
jgi:hypothetical protein